MLFLTHSTLRTHSNKTSVVFTPVFKSFGGLRRASESDGGLSILCFSKGSCTSKAIPRLDSSHSHGDASSKLRIAHILKRAPQRSFPSSPRTMITLRRLRSLVLSSLPGFSSALKLYQLLSSPASYHPRHRHARRRCSTGVLLVLFTPCLVIAGFIVASWIPPSFQDIRKYERNLPQHSIGIGEKRRYLRFPDHIWGHGLNNILQEAYAVLSLNG